MAGKKSKPSSSVDDDYDFFESNTQQEGVVYSSSWSKYFPAVNKELQYSGMKLHEHSKKKLNRITRTLIASVIDEQRKQKSKRSYPAKKD